MKLLKGLDFGSYDTLQQMMNDPRVNFKTVNKLDFSNSTHNDTPPAKALQLLTKLTTLNLSKNSISRFNVSGLIKGAPLLQELGLSYNNITVLDDIVELGCLQHLRILNIKENPIVKKFLRVKLIEAVIFPSKYKPYNAVKILTASYNTIPNKAKLDPKTEEESKKFYRLLERDEEEMDIDGKFSRLCKFDHQTTLIKLSLQPCPVPRKTRFPMLTILNEEIISVQEIQSIMMTEDLSEIIIRKGIDDVAETERVTRKDEELHQEYLLRYTKKKEKRKERQEDEMKSRRDASEIKSEHVQTMRDLMGNYGITKNVDYQDELWKQPVDMKYRNAEYNIGITEFKTMMKDYEKYKEQEREDSEKRKKEYWKKMREKAAKKKGLVKKSDMTSANNINEEELPSNREIERLFRKRVLKHGKPRMKLEMKYSVEQGSSDTDVEEINDEDEKEEWDEDEFLADEDVEGKTPGSSDAPQAKSKNDEFTEKKKLAKQMTLIRISSLGDKKDEEKSPKNGIVLEESVKDFVLEENTVAPKSTVAGDAKEENHSLILNFEPKEPVESKRMSLTATAAAPRRGRRFFVVNESEPNLSLTAYGKITERSVKARELSYKAKKEDGSKSDLERQPSSSSRMRKTARPDGLDLLTYQNEQKENTIELLSGGTEFSSPTKGSEYQDNTGAQPDQNPNSGIKVPEEAKNRATKALNEIMKDTIQANPNQGTLFQQGTYKRPMDIALPQDTKSFDQPVSSNRSLNTSYTLNRHLRVYKPSTNRDKNNVSLRTSRNGLSSVRGLGTKTTEDSSLPPTKDDYQLAGQREVPKIPLVLSRGDSMEKSPLRKNGHVTWEHQRPGLSTSYSARAFKITSTSSSKSPVRQTTSRPVTQDFSIQPHIVRRSISPKSPIQIPESGMVSIVQSPTAIKYIESGDLSPNKRFQGKESRFSQTPKAGGKIRYESPNKIIIHDGSKSAVSKPRGTKVEDLIPGPEDGVPEGLKLRILNNRGPLYNKLLETAKMLDETEDIIKASNEVGDRVLATHFKRPKMDTVDPKILSYNQLTEFLRDYEKGRNLTFADDKDVRELGQLVNEYAKIEESAMNKLDVEVKLRNLKMEALELEGDELEKKYMEIERYVRYLELIENLEKYKDNQRNSNKVDKLLDIDIKRAEHNAILATHYMKMEKYCDTDYLYGLMDPDLRKVNQMGAQRVKTARAELPKPDKLERENVRPKKKRPTIVEVDGEKRPKRKGEEPADNKQENLSQYIKRVKEDKNKATREYPYLRTEPVHTDDKLQWLNVTLVNKYEPKPMFKIEELMEEKKRRAHAEYLKKNPSTLTVAEKTIRHAEEFKEGAKLKKVLKAKVEKYIVDGTKELDKLLENEKTEIESRYNQKKMFGEYMDLLWKKKL